MGAHGGATAATSSELPAAPAPGDQESVRREGRSLPESCFFHWGLSTGSDTPARRACLPLHSELPFSALTSIDTEGPLSLGTFHQQPQQTYPEEGACDHSTISRWSPGTTGHRLAGWAPDLLSAPPVPGWSGRPGGLRVWAVPAALFLVAGSRRARLEEGLRVAGG